MKAQHEEKARSHPHPVPGGYLRPPQNAVSPAGPSSGLRRAATPSARTATTLGARRAPAAATAGDVFLPRPAKPPGKCSLSHQARPLLMFGLCVLSGLIDRKGDIIKQASSCKCCPGVANWQDREYAEF